MQVSSVPYSGAFRYLTCLSLATGSSAPCRDLNKLEGRPAGADEEGSGAHVCRSYYAEGSLSRALVSKSPKAQSVCEEMTKGMLTDPAQVRRICALLIKNRNDLAAVCREAVPQLKTHKSPITVKMCERQLRGLWGDRKECAVSKDRQETEICELARLLRTGGACGDDRYCMALTGKGPAACEPLREGRTRSQ